MVRDAQSPGELSSLRWGHHPARRCEAGRHRSMLRPDLPADLRVRCVRGRNV